MADPVFTPCPKGQWTKVASGVTSGTLTISLTAANYLRTYRMAGNLAPTLRSDGLPIFKGRRQEEIKSDLSIDVYIWCDDYDGSVEVAI